MSWPLCAAQEPTTVTNENAPQSKATAAQETESTALLFLKGILASPQEKTSVKITPNNSSPAPVVVPASPTAS